MMKVAKSWKEVTIKQFQEVYLILMEQDLEPLDRNIHLISALSVKNFEEVESLPFSEFKRLVKQTEFLHSLNSMPSKIQESFFLTPKTNR